MLIFLYGEDTYRSRKKLAELKDKFRREVDPKQSSLNVLDGENIDLNKISEHVSSASLFVRKRMVIVENALKNKSKEFSDNLYAYLAGRENAGADDSIVIFWDETAKGKNKLFKFLAGLQFAYEFKTLSSTEAINWAKKEAASQGGNLRPQAASALTAIFGSNLWFLKNELDKIINYKKAMVAAKALSGKSIADKNLAAGAQVDIEEADIRELCRGKLDENIFALTDAMSSRQKGRALELLESELDNGMNDSYLLFMIIRQFRILATVRQALDLGHSQRKLAGDLKLHPFVAQKSISQAHHYSLKTLTQIFSALIKIDKRFKSGLSDIRTDLGLLISRL